MLINKILKSELSVSVWSGGKTTQLFIYPAGSNYALRDFDVRISSATVDESPSQFTLLGGYKRVLMPITAPLTLVLGGENTVGLNGGLNDDLNSLSDKFSDFNCGSGDDGFDKQPDNNCGLDSKVEKTQKTVCLQPLDSVYFDGGVPTTSLGICTDIGIMYSPLYTASLFPTGGGTYNCQKITAVYCLSDNTVICADGKTYTLDAGDFLVMQDDNSADFKKTQTFTVFNLDKNGKKTVAIIATVDKITNK